MAIDQELEVPVWRFAPRLQYQQEQRMRLAALGQAAGPAIATGDTAAAAEIIRQAAPPRPEARVSPLFRQVGEKVRAAWEGVQVGEKVRAAWESAQAEAITRPGPSGSSGFVPDPRFAGQSIGPRRSGAPLPPAPDKANGIDATFRWDKEASDAQFGKKFGLRDMAKEFGEEINRLSSARRSGYDVTGAVGLDGVPVLGDTVDALVSPVGLLSLGLGGAVAGAKVGTEATVKAVAAAVAKNWAEQAAVTSGAYAAGRGVEHVPGYDAQPDALKAIEQIGVPLIAGIAAYKAVKAAPGIASSLEEAGTNRPVPGVAQLPWESAPGLSSPKAARLPGYSSAPVEQQAEYHSAITAALRDESGADILARHFGTDEIGAFEAPGVYQGQVAPGTQELRGTKVVPAKDGTLRVAPDVRARLDGEAAARARLLHQDAGSWVASIAVTDPAQATTSRIAIGRVLTDGEARALDAELTGRLGPGKHALVMTEDGVIPLNLSEMPAAEYDKVLADAADAVWESTDVQPRRGWIATDSNDWRAIPDGEEYTRRIGASGRTDLPDEVSQLLSGRVAGVDDEFARRYGWGPGGSAAEPGAAGAGVGPSGGTPGGTAGLELSQPAVTQPTAADAGRWKSLRATADVLGRFEPTGLVARGYGQLLKAFGGGKRTGFGNLPAVITDAPDLYDEAGMLNFKNVIENTPGLPISAKVSNAFWKTLARVGSERAALRIDDPRAYYVRQLYELNDSAITSIADHLTETLASPALASLKRDELGHALTAEGRAVNLINERGVPLPGKATWNDILTHPGRYPEAMAGISAEQMDAIRVASAKLDEMQTASKAMGITVSGAVAPSEGGVYLPRGRPEARTIEQGPRRRLSDTFEGRKAGSTQERQYATQSAGIADGKAYPDPVEAYRQAVAENLRQQNAMHAWNLLKEIQVDTHGGIGAAQVSSDVAGELGTLRGDIRAGSKELRGLKARQAVADRDARLAGTWIDHARDRVRQLYDLTNTRGTTSAAEQVIAAREAISTARTAMDDSLSAAADLVRRMPTQARAEGSARSALNDVVADARVRSRRLNELSDSLARAEAEAAPARQLLTDIPNTAGSPAAPTRAAVTEALGQMSFVAKFRQQVYTEAARMDAEISALPFDDSRAAFADAHAAAKETKALFSGSVAEARRRSIDAQAFSRVEGRAAINTRVAMTEGRMKELERVVAQRRATVMAAQDKSTELGAKIAQLSDELEPLRTRRKELLQQVNEVRSIAHERGLVFDGEIGLVPGRGIPVPLKIANGFNKAVKEAAEKGPLTSIFDLVNDGMRMLGASADMSRQMTVGVLGGADNPALAGKAFAAGVRTAKDPRAVWTALKTLEDTNSHLPSIAGAIGRDGLQVSAAENSLAAGATRSAGLAKLGRLPVFREADALYSAPGNVDRVSRYYKLLNDWKAAGKDYTSSQARSRAANVANLTSGRARSGVFSPFFGEEISGRLAFAGRFVQSQFDTVGNAILVGGVEGDEARKALLRLAAGGMATMAGYNAFAQSVGMDYMPWDEFLDPTAPNFARVRVAGHDISIFGPWDSLVKGVVYTAQGDPQYFVRSKLAPAASLAYSALGVDLPLVGQVGGGGENAIGKPLGWKDVTPIPFGVRDIGETAANTDFTDPTALGALGITTVTALAGIKNSSMSPFEKLNALAQRSFGSNYFDLPAQQQEANALAQRSFGSNYVDLPAQQQEAIRKLAQRSFGSNFFDLPAQQQEAIRKEHPDTWGEYLDHASEKRQDYEDAKANFSTEQEGRDKDLLGGQISLQEWSTANDRSKAELSGKAAAIFGEEHRKPRNAGDRYFKTINDQTRNGVTNWDAVDTWVASQSPEDQKFIETDRSSKATPLLRLEQALKDQYYAIPKYRNVPAEHGGDIDALYQTVRNNSRSADDADMLRALRLLPDVEKYDATIVYYVRRKIIGLLEETGYREKWRGQHPESVILGGSGKLSAQQIAVVQAAAEKYR